MNETRKEEMIFYPLQPSYKFCLNSFDIFNVSHNYFRSENIFQYLCLFYECWPFT